MFLLLFLLLLPLLLHFLFFSQLSALMQEVTVKTAIDCEEISQGDS